MSVCACNALLLLLDYKKLTISLVISVVGLAYGSTIQDWKLVRLSLRNESISLLVCIVIGIIIAAICGVTKLAETWPTSEMASRGTLQNFLVALPVAFFSGLGVAVSLLDEQTASLVGVAISASLLPPAGKYINEDRGLPRQRVLRTHDTDTASMFTILAAVNAGIIWIYYAYVQAGRLADPADDVPGADEKWGDRGLLSLFLTLANIILIWIASMFMFRMKEVLPIEKKVFWSDLGVARKIYQRRALLEVVEVDNEPAEKKEEEGEEQ